MPSSACSRQHRALHSFPTRRSSDLQYLWDVINPNPARWKPGVRFLHHLLVLHKDDPAVRTRVMTALGRLYFSLLQDYARAAFWWQKRSEEHTSELQSHVNLVCRLLLAPANTALYTLSLHDALPISSTSGTSSTPTRPAGSRGSASCITSWCCTRTTRRSAPA